MLQQGIMFTKKMRSEKSRNLAKKSIQTPRGRSQNERFRFPEKMVAHVLAHVPAHVLAHECCVTECLSQSVVSQSVVSQSVVSQSQA